MGRHTNSVAPRLAVPQRVEARLFSAQERAEAAAKRLPLVAVIYGRALSKLDSPAETDRQLEDLATAAATAAVDEIGEAYQNPHVRTAALRAAKMAVGLQSMTEQGGYDGDSN